MFIFYLFIFKFSATNSESFIVYKGLFIVKNAIRKILDFINYSISIYKHILSKICHNIEFFINNKKKAAVSFGTINVETLYACTKFSLDFILFSIYTATNCEHMFMKKLSVSWVDEHLIFIITGRHKFLRCKSNICILKHSLKLDQ